MLELLPLILFVALAITLLVGIPVAFALAGVGLAFALLGIQLGIIETVHLTTLPIRIYGVLNNQTLIAVPAFIFMGLILEKSKVAEDLLNSLTILIGRFPGGLGLVVVTVGGMLAASTGIVGATVVMLSVLALPSMLKHGWAPSAASGLIAATGTLGQLIPPSIALIILSDVMATAHQQAQLQLGNFIPSSISVGQVFMGALLPGVLLVSLYGAYTFIGGIVSPDKMPTAQNSHTQGEAAMSWPSALSNLFPPVALILLVLGSIVTGVATPTEASGLGAVGGVLISLVKRRLSVEVLREVSKSTLTITSMVFGILIGASIFSLVFRELGGDTAVKDFFASLPGGAVTAVILLMLIIFILGFFLDFIEITYIVLPIAVPSILILGIDPLWLAILIAINLQTSFLTPPFGFALFYLRGAAPDIPAKQIYLGVLPFVALQLITLGVVALFPSVVSWFPTLIYG